MRLEASFDQPPIQEMPRKLLLLGLQLLLFVAAARAVSVKLTSGCPPDRYDAVFAAPHANASSMYEGRGDGLAYSTIEGVTITENNDYIVLNPPDGKCFANLSECPCGLYVRLLFKTLLGHQDLVLFSTGAQLGVRLRLDSANRLVATISGAQRDWIATGGLVAVNEWSLAELNWFPASGGLRLHLNSRLVGQDTKGTPRSGPPQPAYGIYKNDWLLGMDNSVENPPHVEDKKFVVHSLHVSAADKKKALTDEGAGEPVRYLVLPFESIDSSSSTVPHPDLPGGVQLSGGASLVPAAFGRALHLPGRKDSLAELSLTPPLSDRRPCLADLSRCGRGLTLRVWLRPLALPGVSVLISAPPAFRVSSRAGRLSVRVQVGSEAWLAGGPSLTLNAWQLVEFTWQRGLGLQVYVNGSLMDTVKAPNTPALASKATEAATLRLGSDPDVSDGENWPACDIDELQLWEAGRGELVTRELLVPPLRSVDFDWRNGAPERNTEVLQRTTLRGRPFYLKDGALRLHPAAGDSVVFPLAAGPACLRDATRLCPEGFSLSLTLRINVSGELYLATCGGLEVAIRSGQLITTVRPPGNRQMWRVAMPAESLPPAGSWFRLTVGWQPEEGLLVYVDDTLTTAAYLAMAPTKSLEIGSGTGELVVGGGTSLEVPKTEEKGRDILDLAAVTWWNAKYSYVLARRLFTFGSAGVEMKSSAKLPAGSYQNQGIGPAWSGGVKKSVRIGQGGQIVYQFSGVPDNILQDLEFSFRTTKKDALLWYSSRSGHSNVTISLLDGTLRFDYDYLKESVVDSNHVQSSKITIFPKYILYDGRPHSLSIKKNNSRLYVRIDGDLFESHVVDQADNFWLIPDRGTVHVARHPDHRLTPQFTGVITGNTVVLNGRPVDLISVLDSSPESASVPYTITGDISLVDEGPTTTPPPPRTPPIFKDALPMGNKKVAFTLTGNHLTLNSFDSMGQLIEFEFITNEPRGVLFYTGHDGSTKVGDAYLMLEIFDGVFYFLVRPPTNVNAMDLRFRISPEGTIVNDLRAHKVRLWIRGSVPAIEFDGTPKDFGDTTILNHRWAFNSYTYIGIDTEHRLPFVCWSRVRFQGCINYILISSHKTNELGYVQSLVTHQANDAGRNVGCSMPRLMPCKAPVINVFSRERVDICFPANNQRAPTANPRTCSDRWYENSKRIVYNDITIDDVGKSFPTRNFFCDCRHSRFTRDGPDDAEFSFMGAPCYKNARLEFVNGNEKYLVTRFKSTLGNQIETHHDDISIRFQTQHPNGCLFKAILEGSRIFMEAYLEDGKPVIATNMHYAANEFGMQKPPVLLADRSAERYDDNQWHTLIVKRRANEIDLYVDDDTPGRELGKLRLKVNNRDGFKWKLDLIEIGGCNLETKTGPNNNFYGFNGKMQNFHWLTSKYLYDLFTSSSHHELGPPRIPLHLTTLAPPPMRPTPPANSQSNFIVTFLNNHLYSEATGHIGSILVSNSDAAGFTMDLKFRTQDSKALLVFLNILQESGKYFGLELYNGRLRYSLNLGSDTHSDFVPYNQMLNNDGWHRIWLHAFTPNRYDALRMYFYINEDRIEGPRIASRFSYQSELYIAGVPDRLSNQLERMGFLSHASHRFTGCMSSLVVSTQSYGDTYLLNDQRSVKSQPAESTLWGSTCRVARCADSIGYCSNGGTCRELTGTNRLVCDCPAGYGGDQCRSIPTCEPGYCGIYGSCDCMRGRYPCAPQCTCFSGWWGERCERRVTCPSDFRCENGGKCECDPTAPGTGCTPRCSCPIDFAGSRCERTLRCEPAECNHNGICYCDPTALHRKICDPRCNCRQYYSGLKCGVFDCRALLNNCNGRGSCNCATEDDCRCDCNYGYTGRTCDIAPVLCDTYDCLNGGLCRVIGGIRSCDCARSGYLLGDDDRCSKKALGFLISAEVRDFSGSFIPTPGGYYVLPVLPPRATDADNVTLGFQTYRGSGTLLTFNGTDGVFWSLEAEDGQLKVNQNGVRHVIGAQVSGFADGGYHTVYTERTGRQFRVLVDGVEAPVLSTHFSNFPYHQIIFGADPQGQNLFSGTIGNFKWNGKVYDSSSLPEGGARPSSEYVKIITVPATLQRPPQCATSPNYCLNGGTCEEKNFGLTCLCKSPFYGPRCSKNPWGVLVKLADNTPACASLFVPLTGSAKSESFRLRFQTYQARSVLATVFNKRGQFWQLFLKGGSVHLRDSVTGDHRSLSDSYVSDGQPHMVSGTRDEQGVSFSVDQSRAREDRYILHRDLFEPGGLFNHGGMQLGVGNFSDGVGRPELSVCFQGALGDIEWLGIRPVEEGGVLCLGCSLRPRTIQVVQFPTRLPNENDVELDSVGGQLPPNGGFADLDGVDGAAVFSPGSDGRVHAVGAGAVVLAGGGGGGAVAGTALGAAGFGGGGLGGVSAWIAGLVLALLLLLSALLWAFCHCKPGYCLCCAKGAAGYGTVDGLAKDMSLAQMKTDLGSPGIVTLESQNGNFAAASPLAAAAIPLLAADKLPTFNFPTDKTELAQLSSVRNQFNSAFSSGRRRRQANGAAAYSAGGGAAVAINQTDIGLVDRSAVDGRQFVHLQAGGSGYHTVQQLHATDALSVRSVPHAAATATWSGGRAMAGGARQDFDAMSDMAYRPRQTFTVGRDRVLDIASNYHIEAVGAEGAAARAQENVFLSENIKVDCALITQNSKYVVTGNAGGSAQVWDCETGDLIKVMDGRDVGCTEIHLACDDSMLIGLVMDEASGRHRLQMWDFAHGREVTPQNDTFCSTITVNRSGTHAVLASVDPVDEKAGDLLVWDVASNQATRSLPLPSIPGLSDTVITYLRVSREDQFAVAGFPNSATGLATYLVYDLSLPGGTLPLQTDFEAIVSCTELGAGEAVTGTSKGELLVWALGTGVVERPIVLPNGLLPHQSPIKTVCWSTDGRLLASGGADALVKVWDMTSESLLFTLEGHTEDVQSVSISADSEILASAGWDGSIRVWKLNDGSQLCWFTSNIEIFKVILSRDKRCLVGLGERANNRKLIMLQIIRQKSRRTRSRNQSGAQTIEEV